MRSKYKPFITVRPFEGPKCRACFLLEQRGNSLYIPFPQLHSHIKAVDKKRNRKRKQQASPLARAPPTLRMEGEEMELGDCDPVMAQCTPLMWPNEVSYQDPSGADSSSQGRSSWSGQTRVISSIKLLSGGHRSVWMFCSHNGQKQ